MLKGVSLDKAKKEIEDCHNLDGLKHIYGKYPALQKDLYPLIMERKELIENSIQNR